MKFFWLVLFLVFYSCGSASKGQELLSPDVRFVRDLPFRTPGSSWGCVTIFEDKLISGSIIHSLTEPDRFYLCQFESDSGKKISQIQIPASNSQDFKVTGSADGSLIALAYDNAVDLRTTTELDSTEKRIALQFSSSEIAHLSLSPDASQVAVSLRSGLVSIYDCKTGKQLHQTFLREKSGVRCIYSPIGEPYLLSEQTFWSWSNRERPEPLIKFADKIIKAAVVSDSAIYLVLEKKNKSLLDVIDETKPSKLAKFERDGSPIWEHEAGIYSIGLCAERLVLASLTRLYDVDQNTGSVSEIGHCLSPDKLTFSADGELLVGDVNGFGFQTWSSEGWVPHASNSLPFSHAYSATVDDHGKLTVQSMTHTWEAEWDKSLENPIPLPKDVNGISSCRALSSDAKWFAYTDSMSALHLVDRQQGNEIRTVKQGRVKTLSFNRDGTILLVAAAPAKSDKEVGDFLKSYEEALKGKITREPLPAEIIELSKFERVREVDIGEIDSLHLPKLDASSDQLVMKTFSGFHWVKFLEDGKALRRSVPGTVWDISLSNFGSVIAATHAGKLVFYETYGSRPKVLIQLQGPQDLRRVETEIAADGKTAFVGISNGISGNKQQEARVFAIDVTNKKTIWDIPLPASPKRLQLSPSGNFLLIEIETDLQWAIIKLQ